MNENRIRKAHGQIHVVLAVKNAYKPSSRPSCFQYFCFLTDRTAGEQGIQKIMRLALNKIIIRYFFYSSYLTDLNDVSL